jgi:hypothetical protein
LVGDTNARWSVVLAKFVDFPRHCGRITSGSRVVNVT